MTDNDQVPNSPKLSRRRLIQVPAALAAASAASVAGSAGTATAEGALVPAKLDPVYYPLTSFTPQVDLRGKTAVVTGASRGIGRAIAEALHSLGVEVHGTSRNWSRVPNPPAYRTLTLDITSDASVNQFAGDLTSRLGGRRLDILINNAGRAVIGGHVPPAGGEALYLTNNKLALETLYHGHIRVTTKLLPLLPEVGYGRILFTISVAAYEVGGVATDTISPFISTYISGKRALLSYANNLRATLRTSSPIEVSTVNPYAVRTTLCEHPNPIYLETVNDSGMAPGLPTSPMNLALTALRATLREPNGMPPEFVAKAYVQLLQSFAPPPNVVGGSPAPPYSVQGLNAIIDAQLLAENLESAVRYSGGLL